MKRVPSKQRNFVIHRERDRAALKRLALMLLSGLVLAGGFVYAAGQHFSALRFGYEGEKLRSERTRLLEEQHRLLLEREVAATPARLETAARELGMHPVQSAQIDPAKRAKRTLAALLRERGRRCLTKRTRHQPLSLRRQRLRSEPSTSPAHGLLRLKPRRVPGLQRLPSNKTARI